MRFSDTGYYIESYIKCGNCGVLVYDEGVTSTRADLDGVTFCSDWCISWKEQKLDGVSAPKIKTA